MKRVDLAVIGGGITGLAAAWEARRQGADVLVIDASDRPGGKLLTSEVAGLPVDESADAFLARRPEAVGLCRELGIEKALVSPAVGNARLWSPATGQLRPLPPSQLLGVPTDLDELAGAGLLSPAGLARAAEDLERTGTCLGADEDITVGALVRSRLGDEVHDLLVAPLLGGVWAGDTDQLSVEVTAPAIAEAARRDASLIRGARTVREAGAAAAAPGAPVFYAPSGGMAALVRALTDQLGDTLRPAEPVTALSRGSGPGGWRIEPTGTEAGAVVVATPARPAAGLVGPWCRPAADVLADIPHASVVMVTLAVPREGIDHALDGSGFLMPRGSDRLLTACSWASSKWAHLAGDGSTALLRVSAGHAGDSRALEMTDEELIARLQDDLGATMGLRVPPVEVRVRRWIDGLPQPTPGHLARMTALEETLAADAPGLAVAGAWARGVGIPACIASGRQATARLLAH